MDDSGNSTPDFRNIDQDIPQRLTLDQREQSNQQMTEICIGSRQGKASVYQRFITRTRGYIDRGTIMGIIAFCACVAVLVTAVTTNLGKPSKLNPMKMLSSNKTTIPTLNVIWTDDILIKAALWTERVIYGYVVFNFTVSQTAEKYIFPLQPAELFMRNVVVRKTNSVSRLYHDENRELLEFEFDKTDSNLYLRAKLFEGTKYMMLMRYESKVVAVKNNLPQQEATWNQHLIRFLTSTNTSQFPKLRYRIPLPLNFANSLSNMTLYVYTKQSVIFGLPTDCSYQHHSESYDPDIPQEIMVKHSIKIADPQKLADLELFMIDRSVKNAYQSFTIKMKEPEKKITLHLYCLRTVCEDVYLRRIANISKIILTQLIKEIEHKRQQNVNESLSRNVDVGIAYVDSPVVRHNVYQHEYDRMHYDQLVVVKHQDDLYNFTFALLEEIQSQLHKCSINDSGYKLTSNNH